MARELFVEKTADDVVCLEGLKVRCRTLVEDLAGSDPSPVLRLAIEAARSSGDTIPSPSFLVSIAERSQPCRRQ
jgi:hypothetical protein